MRGKALWVLGLAAIVFLAHKQVAAQLQTDNKDGSASSAKFSETDVYLDLKTGKSFRVMYDALNDLYNRDDLFSFDLYVNTRTKDTLWRDEAILVNNALIRSATGEYKIDPMKVKRDGNTFKVKTAATTTETPAPAPAAVSQQ